jgi:glucan endo-1,3-alpha-glucosidase
MHHLVLYLISLFTSVAYALPTLKVRNDIENMSSRQLNSGPKYVVCHHIVGNTYPYVVDDWSNDISLAQSNSIDAFALNVGSDSWQPSRVADAYVPIFSMLDT